MPPPPPAYSGQIPPGPVQVQPEIVKSRFPTWAIIAIIAALVLICACIAAVVFIDTNKLWCTVIPFWPYCP